MIGIGDIFQILKCWNDAIGSTLCHRQFRSATVSWCEHFGCATRRRPFGVGWELGWEMGGGVGVAGWAQCIYYYVLYTDLGNQRYFMSLLKICKSYGMSPYPYIYWFYPLTIQKLYIIKWYHALYLWSWNEWIHQTNSLRPSMHICISKLTISKHQAIIWTNAGILLIWTIRTNFSEYKAKTIHGHTRKCIC